MSAEASPPAPPQCYRHPGRETYIRCSRCERPICPDCMIPASVGFQCPECVREGAASVREARTVFGGRVAGSVPWVSYVLLGLIALSFLAQQVLGNSYTGQYALFGQIGPFGVAKGETYRLLTSAFLHGDWLHVALNAYALWLFGPALEQAFGRSRFAALYLLSALGGSAASYAFSEPGSVSLGASGAIFGLIAATMVVGRRLRRDNTGLWALLAINLALGFLVANIDWRAHVGGLVTGAAVAAALAYAPRKGRTAVHLGAFLAIAALVAVVVLVRTAMLRDADPALIVRESAVAQSAIAPDARCSYPHCGELVWRNYTRVRATGVRLGSAANASASTTRSRR